jgi:hypothetical protein
MTAPRLADVNVPVVQSNKWEQLKQLANAKEIFTPVEIKAYYIIGLVDDICQSVQFLVKADKCWPEKYLPAFSLFASAVDLLGRCLTGNRTLNVNENLRVGFWYLFHPTSSPPLRSLDPTNATMPDLVRTPHLSYSVADLVALRHYSAHGQAASNNLPSVDNELLAQFPKPTGDAMETYWSALQSEVEYCTRLGDALIDLYANRAEPLSKTLNYFARGDAAGDLFYRLDWSV